MRVLAAGRQPPIFETFGLSLVEVERGRTVLEGTPDRRFHNPGGSVQDGYAATMLDMACSSAVHSQLTAEQGYTTLELKVTYLRALSGESCQVRAEGRVVSMGRQAAFAEGRLTDGNGALCATATSTLLLFERRAAG